MSDQPTPQGDLQGVLPLPPDLLNQHELIEHIARVLGHHGMSVAELTAQAGGHHTLLADLVARVAVLERRVDGLVQREAVRR